MIERATLQVLAELAEIGLPEAVDVPLSTFDPILRPFLRRRVRAAIADAEARCRSMDGTGGMPVEHMLWAAFVLRHPATPIGLNVRDDRALREVYRTLSAPFTGIPADQALRPRPSAYRASADPNAGQDGPVLPGRKRRWPLTAPLLAAASASALAVLLAWAAPYFIPTPEERFRGTAFGRAIEEPLTHYVAQVNQDRDPEALARLVTPAVRKQIGPKAYAALTHAIDQVAPARTAQGSTMDEATRPLLSSINELDHALADHGVPAVLLGYARGSTEEPGAARSVWLTSYYVERRISLTFEGWTGLTAWGRRIDGLNLTDDDVYKSDAQDWAILSLDRVEEELVGLVLASMASGAALGPKRYDPSDSSAHAVVARALGPLLAADVQACSGVTTEDAQRIAVALKSRNDAALELRITTSDRLRLTPWLVRELTPQGTWSPLARDLLRTNERLTMYGRRFAPAVEQLARLEEEELMGRLLYQQKLQGTAAPKLGTLSPEERAVGSAELALLARPEACPRLALWRAASMFYEPQSSRDYEVGAIVFAALVRQLGLPPPAEDAAAAGAVIEEVMRTPPGRLREAASRAYRDLYGMTPPVFARVEAP